MVMVWGVVGLDEVVDWCHWNEPSAGYVWCYSMVKDGLMLPRKGLGGSFL